MILAYQMDNYFLNIQSNGNDEKVISIFMCEVIGFLLRKLNLHLR